MLTRKNIFRNSPSWVLLTHGQSSFNQLKTSNWYHVLKMLILKKNHAVYQCGFQNSHIMTCYCAVNSWTWNFEPRTFDFVAVVMSILKKLLHNTLH